MDLVGQPFDSLDSRQDARVQLAQGRPFDSNRGYAMAALLVGMSVMAVLMGALLPVWTTMAKREKEAELVFRGQQYARAIGLFQRKFANTPPPTIDILVEQRFLRKKYKDPITNDEFQPLYANQAMLPGGPTGPSVPGAQTQRSATGAPGGQLLQPGFGATGATAAGGIIGVTSKSKDTSLRVYNGRTRYNEWAFVHVQTSQRPTGPGGPTPGGVQQPGGPNQRTGPQGSSPFGMPPGSFPNQQRPGQAMPPPPFGQPNRPPFPNPQFQPLPGVPPGQFPNQQFPPGGFPNPNQPRPGQRPPGQEQ